MAKTYKFKDRVQASRDRIQEILIDKDMREEEATKIGGSVEARCTIEEVRPDMLRIVVDKKDYARGMDGKKDTSRTEDVKLTFDWDCKAYKGTWIWRMASQGDKLDIKGSTTLLPDGDGCYVLEEGSIAVKIPMIGKMIEGKVKDGIEKSRPKWVDWLKSKI